MKKVVQILFICIVAIVFFWQFFVKGLLPIPADTIIGLYHPFRDLYIKDYPNGIPFKNFLITDPVRQQYPWRKLAILIEKELQLPLWNPYNFSGTPLLANFQSASFYPLNILLFVMPFSVGWSFLILLAPLLGTIFLFLYLDNLKLSKWACMLGALTFSFSGFSIAWLEWGTITHVALWLPLILLSTDKIFADLMTESSKFPSPVGRQVQSSKLWYFIFIFSLVSSFFGGHLQIFFYLFIFSWAYFLARWFQFGLKKKMLFLFIVLNSLFIIPASIQWVPTLQLIFSSARSVDLISFNSPGWFIPWQNLIQFIAPDFFGNPTTLNYWGIWNYAEFIGYVGITPLIFALFAMFFRRDKKTLFFGTLFFSSLIFSLPTIFAKLPYYLNIPFISTSQPTRLLFVTDFSLAVLAAFGFDYLLKVKRKITIIYPLIFVVIVLVCIWIFIPRDHMVVVKNNLLLPTLLIILSSILFIAFVIFKKKNKLIVAMCIFAIILAMLDLMRFGWKFSPFTKEEYLFPSTKTIEFLKKNIGFYRVMSVDPRILPPNFSTIYKLQSIEGYDPLYLLRYGELIAASERKRPDIKPPFGFNRIITPNNYESRIIDLLGVKYILSLSILDSFKLTKVFQEGRTAIYENKNTLPRAFFVKNIKLAANRKDAIKMLFESSINLIQTGIVENGNKELDTNWSIGSANIIQYSANNVIIDTENRGSGFLILTDTFYPTWRLSVDNRPTKIYLTDYNFRGAVVPAGKHRVEFINKPF